MRVPPRTTSKTRRTRGRQRSIPGTYMPLYISTLHAHDRFSPGRYRRAQCRNAYPTDCEPPSHRAKRVALREDIEVPPHPERFVSPSPDLILFGTSTNPTNRRRRRSSGSRPPRLMFKPHPHQLIVDLLVLIMELHHPVNITSRDNVEVSLHPGTSTCHPRKKSIHKFTKRILC